MSQQAMESELLGKTVSGRVTAKTEDGVLVDIGDQLVGLLPVDEMKGSDPWEWQERLQGLTVGDEVLVKVIQVKPRHKNGEPNLLLSEHEANLDLLAAQLTGARVSGHIVEKTTHGVFVNLHNGLEGFVHVSDLQGTTTAERDARLRSLEDGDGVTVAVIGMERQCGGYGPRIGLKEVAAAA